MGVVSNIRNGEKFLRKERYTYYVQRSSSTDLFTLAPNEYAYIFVRELVIGSGKTLLCYNKVGTAISGSGFFNMATYAYDQEIFNRGLYLSPGGYFRANSTGLSYIGMDIEAYIYEEI